MPGALPAETAADGRALSDAPRSGRGPVPELNGFDATEPYTPSGVHFGLAVAMRGGGLIAPAILEAAVHGRGAISWCRRCAISWPAPGPDGWQKLEITQGTITISSLGETGADALYGVIYPPQVALVGFGSPRLKPVVHDGRPPSHAL